MNIICGPNGVGKTTILECVAHSFALNNTDVLRRNIGFDVGSIKTNYTNKKVEQIVDIEIDKFSPRDVQQVNGKHELSNQVLSFKTGRQLVYQRVDAIALDQVHKTKTFEEVKKGVASNTLKNWFVSRDIYSTHEGALSKVQMANLTLAKSAFEKIDPRCVFSHVEASSNDIMVSIPDGTIYFEFLSSGYQSCLYLILGIIKEIEHRFKEDKLAAAKFSGIVLIDELELHLHPEWQARISEILTKIFPQAQFIVTTHSPHVIQTANPEEVVALEFMANGVMRRKLLPSEAGYLGWTIEEILKDVMGMPDARSGYFNALYSKFTDALDTENLEEAKSAAQKLFAVLHLENAERKLIRFQLASIGISIE